MKYRAFGRTGRDVSEVSFGAWAIGSSWGAVDDSESIATMHAIAGISDTLIRPQVQQHG
ncbi:MAG: putative oxidoreductase [Chloroflexi bacterium OLB13]|nr:MAG: putative oxidoreductase [Chloroflexi bacterium OLB13]